MKKFLFIILFFIVAACSSNSVLQVKKEQPFAYATIQDVKNALASKNKTYVLFSSEWCSSCLHLKKLLKQEGIIDNILILNVEQTWAFLFSRQLKIEGVPTLFILENEIMSSPRTGANKILVFLLANIDK